MRRSGAISLVVWLLICFGAAAIGSIGSLASPEFYQQLSRPDCAPPAWLFGPVWTVLYTLQAISAWAVWRRRRSVSAARPALLIFFMQLAANALWTWLFFAWRRGEISFVEILLLVALIAVAIALFARAQRWAAILLLPYLAWVTFAAALTYSIWQRNPQLLGG